MEAYRASQLYSALADSTNRLVGGIENTLGNPRGMLKTALAVGAVAALAGCGNPRGYFNNFDINVDTLVKDRPAGSVSAPKIQVAQTNFGQESDGFLDTPYSTRAPDPVSTVDAVGIYKLEGIVDTGDEEKGFASLVFKREKIVKALGEYAKGDTIDKFVQSLYVDRNAGVPAEILGGLYRDNPDLEKGLAKLGVTVESSQGAKSALVVDTRMDGVYTLSGLIDTRDEEIAFAHLVSRRNEIIKELNGHMEPDRASEFVQSFFVFRNAEYAGQILAETIEKNPEAEVGLAKFGISVEESTDGMAVLKTLVTVAGSVVTGGLGGAPLAVIPPVSLSIKE